MSGPDRLRGGPRVLILGGTSEARELAQAAAVRWGRRVAVVSSLAGLTGRPARREGVLRRGGFGGPGGLAAYLRRERIGALVDATHPFATTMSRHARLAADAAGVPRLRLLRPGWRRQRGDRWFSVADAREAARVAGRLGRRIWLTFAGRELAAFARLRGRRFLVRRIEDGRPSGLRPPPRLIRGRGPFTVRGELRILKRHRIDVLVTKASGAAATAAKLTAARVLGLPVVMIRRPRRERGARAFEVAQALAWLGVTLDRARPTPPK